MSADTPRTSLVVPVYRNSGSIPDLIAAIERIAAAQSGSFEAIFVADGSPDDSYALLQARLPQAQFTSRLIALSRNFGSFAAIREGLKIAKGDYIAVMAADLQEPPELVPAFYEVLGRGEAEVVFGQRSGRDDPFGTRVAAGAFWWLYRRLVQAEMPEGGVDVFAIHRTVRDALVRLEPIQTSLVGQLVWLGFRRLSIPYVRQTRRHGKSGWSLRKKIDYMLDSLFAFTDLPIRIFLNLGLVGMLLCVVAGVVIFTAWLLGGITVPGYTPLALLILFFAALNLFGLGIVGQYAARAFEAAKQRPGAVVMRDECYAGLGRELNLLDDCAALVDGQEPVKREALG
jgi:glycosyltransferase involved in cell wall biosynthesis